VRLEVEYERRLDLIDESGSSVDVFRC